MAFSHRCEDEPEEDKESTEHSHHVPTNIVQGDCIAVTFEDDGEPKTMVAKIAQINRLTETSVQPNGKVTYKKTWCPKFAIDKDAYPVEGKYQITVEYFHGGESDFTEPRYIDVGIESKGAHEEPRFVCIA